MAEAQGGLGYGLHYRDELDEPVARELDALIARLNGFLEQSFNADGTLKPVAISTASSSPSGVAEEEHWWRHGPWTFDDPTSAASANVAGVRPPKIPGGTYHNYAPAGIEGAVLLELEPDGSAVTLTGISNNDGRKRLMLIRNRDSVLTLTLTNRSSSSFDRNQFNLPGDEDVVMGPGESFWLFYDPGRDGGRWTGAITTNTSGGLAGGVGTLVEVTKDFSITAFNSTAVRNEVVAAPPAGYILIPVSMTIESDKETAGAANGVVELIYDDGAGGFDGFALFTAFNLDGNNVRTTIGVMLGSADRVFTNYTTRDPRGCALALRATAATSGGTGNVRVTLVYRVHASISTQ